MPKKSFEELYQDILHRKIRLKEPLPPEYDPHHLDCLLHPGEHGPVFYTESCQSCEREQERACLNSCIFDAIYEGPEGGLQIDPEKCAGCGACVDACEAHKLSESRDILPAMQAVRKSGQPAYALIAPAFLGQFSEQVTPGQLRNAFKALGFDGMVETALFADVLTMKEALEFDHQVKGEGDFQLTSCCCPVWIAMIRKVYPELMSHVPGAVSPMIACGRVVKKLHPGAVTVFVGPCIAKKSEAREPDVAGAVDYVLTFQEVQDIFRAADIYPERLPEAKKEHSSRAGRIYARSGGVSEAVTETIRQLRPEGGVQLKAEQADGVPACRELLKRIQNGEAAANFFEGMGCKGGCVGGPKAILDRTEGRENVNAYGEEAPYKTPLENPYVIKLMKWLDFGTVEELLEESELFVRHF